MGIIINREDLKSKIYGCWLGKSIGGTLGMPFECNPQVQDITGYTQPTNGEPIPNDDLDLQLIWLKALQDHGPKGVNSRVLGEYWINYIPPHWNEYGISKANQSAGLIPPLSGEYRNNWKHSNGAWIRSEIWACVTPGCPDIAVRYAYEDASVDHGSGEGTYAELFTAAVESAAFTIGDRDELIKIGLSKIPEYCRVARSIRIVLDAYSKGLTWKEAREMVVRDSADLGWFQAPGNLAFMIIGWMYGEGDFGRSICLAANCGDDTDCTAGTLGSILGIISGREGIPAEWSDPIGNRIVTMAVDRTSFASPKTLDTLTEQVIALTPQVLAAHGADVSISDGPTDLSGVSEIDMASSVVAREIWDRSPYAITYDFLHTKVTLDYGDKPEVRAGEPFRLKVILENKLPDIRHIDLVWHLPDGWRALPGSRNHVLLSRWPPRVEVMVDVIAEEFGVGAQRGILEVIAPGRPTVGLIPMVFFEALIELPPRVLGMEVSLDHETDRNVVR